MENLLPLVGYGKWGPTLLVIRSGRTVTLRSRSDGPPGPFTDQETGYDLESWDRPSKILSSQGGREGSGLGRFTCR